jgi:hypothetical protein
MHRSLPSTTSTNAPYSPEIHPSNTASQSPPVIANDRRDIGIDIQHAEPAAQQNVAAFHSDLSSENGNNTAELPLSSNGAV